MTEPEIKAVLKAICDQMLLESNRDNEYAKNAALEHVCGGGPESDVLINKAKADTWMQARTEVWRLFCLLKDES